MSLINSRIPNIIVVFDAVKDKLAILEANKLNIPVISILDTNADPELINFPIPGNDDALRSINLYAELFKSTIIEAKKISSFADEKNKNDLKSENKNKKVLKSEDKNNKNFHNENEKKLN